MEAKTVVHEMEKNYSRTGVEEARVVDSWLMMSSVWPAAILTGAYLFFVVVAGPRLMKGRKPMSLKYPLLVYNLSQVIFSTWYVIKGFQESYGVFFKGSCTPSILSKGTSYEMDSLAWYYLMSKYVEFLDTIFFILRGKWSQVTFLHVYHHSNMAICTWIFVKYISGIQIIMIGLANSFVHAAMYGYYFLAAFGPAVSKFLWWKSYITKLQIVQFLTIIMFMSYLYLQDCNTPSGYVEFTVINTTSFLVLFFLFYMRTYSTKRKVQ